MFFFKNIIKKKKFKIINLQFIMNLIVPFEIKFLITVVN